MSESWTSAQKADVRGSKPAKWNVQADVASPQPAFIAPPGTRQSALPPPNENPSSPPPPAPPVEPEKIVDPALTKEIENLLGLLSNALKELTKSDDDLEERIAEQVLDLGLTVAGELAAGMVEIESKRVSTLIREALTLMEEESVVHVRLHPDVFTVLDEARLLDEIRENPKIQIRMDGSVGPAGCVVESPKKRVDARVEARIKYIRHLLTLDSEAQETEEQD